ncbi:hypothetical protein M3I54_44150 [Paraburkholderia sp. CNPSo 3274]|uniref:hypothetical protein n=1 Tax=unclassified Paraburkholderia TaxID=2615204 RepID=UPI0020B745DC|nr:MULTISPECIES: hypothetical protein [unclassified Paraburkholderia]MCP3713724.1 hypothetical protein [Paraburkholderia sp. CNPSo 3274]MCP3728503.1 hypothetical protein [Paraburkholderia sp. CNPSo 3272]
MMALKKYISKMRPRGFDVFTTRGLRGLIVTTAIAWKDVVGICAVQQWVYKFRLERLGEEGGEVGLIPNPCRGEQPALG